MYAEHLVVVADLELLRVAVEAERVDLLADAGVPVLEVVRARSAAIGQAAVGSRPRSLAEEAP